MKRLSLALLFSACLISTYAQPAFDKYRPENPENKFRYRILSFLEAETSESGWFSSETPQEADLDSVRFLPPAYSGPNGLHYWGDLVNGLPHGYGLSLINNKEMRLGRFVNGKQTGFGYRMANDGTYHQGFFHEGQPSGQGTRCLIRDSAEFESNISLVLRGGSVRFSSYRYCKSILTGNFNQPAGRNQFSGVREDHFYTDKESNNLNLKLIRSGIWVNDKMQGLADIGAEVSMNSAELAVFNGEYHYYGEQLNGDPVGKGTLYVTHGEGKLRKTDIYEGNFTGKVIYRTNLKGKATFSDGTVIEGAFISLSAEGQGKIIRPGSVYEGELKNNLPEGNGKVIYSSGMWFNGKWANGNVVFGELFLPETGETLKGNFLNGNPEGKLTVTRKDGTTGEVFYKDGTRQ